MPLRPTLIAALCLALLATGCSNIRFPGVYRIDIEQGNIVDAKMLERLRPGMTPDQVRYVLGSPQLTDPFDPTRWIYVYRLRRGNGELLESRINLQFENGALARWEGKPLPEGARLGRPAPASAEPTAEDSARPANGY